MNFYSIVFWLSFIIPCAAKLLAILFIAIGCFRQYRSLPCWRWFFWSGLIYAVYFAYEGILLSAANALSDGDVDRNLLLLAILAAVAASAIAVLIARIRRTRSISFKKRPFRLRLFRFSLKEGLAFVSLFSLQLALHTIIKRSVIAYLENAETTGDYWPFVL